MTKEQLKNEIIKLQQMGVKQGTFLKATTFNNMKYLNKQELITIYNASYMTVNNNNKIN